MSSLWYCLLILCALIWGGGVIWAGMIDKDDDAAGIKRPGPSNKED
jgi:hypothetical protein